MSDTRAGASKLFVFLALVAVCYQIFGVLLGIFDPCCLSPLRVAFSLFRFAPISLLPVLIIVSLYLSLVLVFECVLVDILDATPPYYHILRGLQ